MIRFPMLTGPNVKARSCVLGAHERITCHSSTPSTAHIANHCPTIGAVPLEVIIPIVAVVCTIIIVVLLMAVGNYCCKTRARQCCCKKTTSAVHYGEPQVHPQLVDPDPVGTCNMCTKYGSVGLLTRRQPHIAIAQSLRWRSP